MKLKIKPLVKNFETPVYATNGAGAFDIRTQHNITLTVEPIKVELGFAMEVPKGHVALIAPRSGLGIDHGFNLRNTIGVIDSDYRGQICAMISIDNYAVDELYFQKGDRILQCMIVPVEQVELELVDELSKTKRGKGGFGHSGLK